MTPVIEKLLSGKGENYILPFFWIHGETESVLCEYINAIHNCKINAVCVESRPHPDFCGEQWWHDMDIILDEAKKNDMKVWILDDSHFPTGYANGAMEAAPEELCRQGICYMEKKVKSGKVRFHIDSFLNRKNDKFSVMGLMTQSGKKRQFSTDTLFSVTAVEQEGSRRILDLTKDVADGELNSHLPAGNWKLCICKLSHNCGAHRNYINMLDAASCKKQIEAVYEPHWEHYQSEFGHTIAGFFSDEPELGNGVLYSNEKLGADQDLPWSAAIEPDLEAALGENWRNKMSCLWDDQADADEKADVRYHYMNVITKAVQTAFSSQLGEWCREHGVKYIGHLIEDNNQHARTGGSLGHYFRGLSGQDWAGIDDIGGQVMPQGEDGPDKVMMIMKRDGEFYHYILGKLGPSLAGIDCTKNGTTMCEIFGNYGWGEGFRLEKYLADHFMACGVNRFVPHAFSAKEYPDPDCPPHFYAHGHNPQYRHFGSLMGYMNRICELISGGRRIAPVAMLYHAEAEWTGDAMLMQKPARKMTDHQIDFDIVPVDVFIDTEYFHTDLSAGFQVNTQKYQAFVIPYAQYVSVHLINAVKQLVQNRIPVYFIDALPTGVYDGEKAQLEILEKCMDQNSDYCRVVKLDDLISVLQKDEIGEIAITPENNRIRYMHYQQEADIYYLINESNEKYTGTITVPQTKPAYTYHAWDNVLEKADANVVLRAAQPVTEVRIEIEPGQSQILVFDEAQNYENQNQNIREPLQNIVINGRQCNFHNKWKRSMAAAINYPGFSDEKEITFPNNFAQEYPKFSGIIRYENRIDLEENQKTVLVITDAYEGVEVFVNGMSAGVQIVPTYRFDISEWIQKGENLIMIEVSTTLERERAVAKNRTQLEKMQQNKVPAPTGITGEVFVYQEMVMK